MSDWVLGSWFFGTTLGAFVALRYCCHHFGRGAGRLSMSLGLLALALLWLHPLIQHRLAYSAAMSTEEIMAPFVGKPLADFEAAFGEPARVHGPIRVYAARSWYAPFSAPMLPCVDVLSFDGVVVHHVTLDD